MAAIIKHTKLKKTVVKRVHVSTVKTINWQQPNNNQYKGEIEKPLFKNAEKSTPTMLCLNVGSVAKFVIGGNEFQNLTTLSVKN